MHTVTVNKKRGHRFERKQGRVYSLVGEKWKERYGNYILIS